MQSIAAAVETQYLGGKVRKLALPIFEVPPGEGAPPLKRLSLPQGELAQVIGPDQAVRYLAVIELRAGTVRGNHFHRVKEEFIYVITGRALLEVEDMAGKLRDKLEMVSGDLVSISTGVAHRIEVAEAGQAIEFSEARFDASDIHRYVL